MLFYTITICALTLWLALKLRPKHNKKPLKKVARLFVQDRQGIHLQQIIEFDIEAIIPKEIAIPSNRLMKAFVSNGAIPDPTPAPRAAAFVLDSDLGRELWDRSAGEIKLAYDYFYRGKS